MKTAQVGGSRGIEPWHAGALVDRGDTLSRSCDNGNARDSLMTACQLVRSRIDHTRHGRPRILSRRGLSIWIDLTGLMANNEFALFRRPVQSPVFPAIRLWTELPQSTPGDLPRRLCARPCTQHMSGRGIGSVSLLTFPRILGVAFNPVSIYLLRDRDGADAMYIYEVRNTFGDMHSYVGRATG